MKKALLVLILLLAQSISLFQYAHISRAAGLAWPDEWVADSAFYSVWSRADEPVAGGSAARSWLWGPMPFAVANEPYAESSTGLRLVEYMDKTRMESNDPGADRNSQWFVTSGLLVYEMVSGQVQTGNSQFEQRAPADVVVAGDAGSPSAPTYASFSHLTAPAPSQQGKLANQRISREGVVSQVTGQNAPSDARLFGLAAYDDVSKHNIPAVFRDWMLQSGTVLENGRLVQAPLFDPLYTLGRPITEPYWADILVNGQATTVLVQLYERRALTYNPNNKPEWRVEMANVGRAYYDWRYKGQPPAPAIAAEVERDGLRVRGWNWPPSASIQVHIDLAGGSTPLSGPQSLTADAAGRFSTTLPVTPELEGALLSGANVQAKAQAGQAAIALPVAGKVEGGNVQLEGTITQVPGNLTAPFNIQLRARDGQEWTLSLATNSVVRYSEGDQTSPSILRTGTFASVQGTATGGDVKVSEIWLLSVSGTGAKIGYMVQPDRKSIRVSGTGWPAERQVQFTLAHLNTEGPPPLQTVKTDSRGNLTALVPIPGANSLPQASLWLFAAALDRDSLLALVAVPFDLPVNGPPASSLPPQLVAMTGAGDQSGGLGSYCWGGTCADAIGVPVPGNTLRANPGELITFRSQYGTDPNSGISPNNFSAQLYTYDSPSGQVEQVGGIAYFTPKGEPAHSTGNLPGRPFNMRLPQVLPAGKYVLLVQVGWPDPSGGAGGAAYGFLLQAP